MSFKFGELFHNSKKEISTKKIEDPYELEVKTWAKKIGESRESPAGKIKEIMDNIEPYLKHLEGFFSETEIQKIKQDLWACVEITDPEKFADRVREILKPFFAIKKTHPREYEDIRVKVSNEKSGYLPLNRLVTYEIVREGKVVRLHHSEAKTIGPKLNLYREAMGELAQIIEASPEIKNKIETIEAASWIVDKTPTLFTNNGFKVEKLDEKDEKGRNTSLAVIDRDKFLKKFTKELATK